jgi:ribosome-binding factor A
MSVRIERLKEVIHVEAAEMITSHLNDPRIGFCTVTRVELSDDLSHARIYVSVLGTEAQKRTTMRGLTDARGLIQRRIAARMQTRTTPHVDIFLDDSVDRTFQILEKIKEARASDPDRGLSTLEPEAGSEGGRSKGTVSASEDAGEGEGEGKAEAQAKKDAESADDADEESDEEAEKESDEESDKDSDEESDEDAGAGGGKGKRKQRK